MPEQHLFYEEVRLFVKSHTGLPLFPDVTNQVGGGFQSFLSRSPSRRSCFGALFLPYQLECLHLSQGFRDVSSHRWGEHLKALDVAIGVNNKSSSGVHSRISVIDTISGTDQSASIGEHGVGYPAIHHFGELVVVPHLVDIDTVYAYRKDVYSKFFKFAVFFGDRRNFGSSDKGEIAGIKAQDYPFSEKLGKLYLDKVAIVISSC